MSSLDRFLDKLPTQVGIFGMILWGIFDVAVFLLFIIPAAVLILGATVACRLSYTVIGRLLAPLGVLLSPSTFLLFPHFYCSLGNEIGYKRVSKLFISSFTGVNFFDNLRSFFRLRNCDRELLIAMLKDNDFSIASIITLYRECPNKLPDSQNLCKLLVNSQQFNDHEIVALYKGYNAIITVLAKESLELIKSELLQRREFIELLKRKNIPIASLVLMITLARDLKDKKSEKISVIYSKLFSNEHDSEHLMAFCSKFIKPSSENKSAVRTFADHNKNITKIAVNTVKYTCLIFFGEKVSSQNILLAIQEYYFLSDDARTTFAAFARFIDNTSLGLLKLLLRIPFRIDFSYYQDNFLLLHEKPQLLQKLSQHFEHYPSDCQQKTTLEREIIKGLLRVSDNVEEEVNSTSLVERRDLKAAEMLLYDDELLSILAENFTADSDMIVLFTDFYREKILSRKFSEEIQMLNVSEFLAMMKNKDIISNLRLIDNRGLYKLPMITVITELSFEVLMLREGYNRAGMLYAIENIYSLLLDHKFCKMLRDNKANRHFFYRIEHSFSIPHSIAGIMSFFDCLDDEHNKGIFSKLLLSLKDDKANYSLLHISYAKYYTNPLFSEETYSNIFSESVYNLSTFLTTDGMIQLIQDHRFDPTNLLKVLKSTRLLYTLINNGFLNEREIYEKASYLEYEKIGCILDMGKKIDCLLDVAGNIETLLCRPLRVFMSCNDQQKSIMLLENIQLFSLLIKSFSKLSVVRECDKKYAIKFYPIIANTTFSDLLNGNFTEHMYNIMFSYIAQLVSFDTVKTFNNSMKSFNLNAKVLADITELMSKNASISEVMNNIANVKVIELFADLKYQHIAQEDLVKIQDLTIENLPLGNQAIMKYLQSMGIEGSMLLMDLLTEAKTVASYLCYNISLQGNLYHTIYQVFGEDSLFKDDEQAARFAALNNSLQENYERMKELGVREEVLDNLKIVCKKHVDVKAIIESRIRRINIMSGMHYVPHNYLSCFFKAGKYDDITIDSLKEIIFSKSNNSYYISDKVTDEHQRSLLTSLLADYEMIMSYMDSNIELQQNIRAMLRECDVFSVTNHENFTRLNKVKRLYNRAQQLGVTDKVLDKLLKLSNEETNFIEWKKSIKNMKITELFNHEACPISENALKLLRELTLASLNEKALQLEFPKSAKKFRSYLESNGVTKEYDMQEVYKLFVKAQPFNAYIDIASSMEVAHKTPPRLLDLCKVSIINNAVIAEVA